MKKTAKPSKTKKPRHIKQSDWDSVDSPPLDAKALKKMRPAKQVLPAAFVKAVEEGRVGRPKSAHPKRAISLRLDDDLVKALRASGKGWQTELNALVREAVAEGRI